MKAKPKSTKLPGQCLVHRGKAIMNPRPNSTGPLFPAYKLENGIVGYSLKDFALFLSVVDIGKDAKALNLVGTEVIHSDTLIATKDGLRILCCGNNKIAKKLLSLFLGIIGNDQSNADVHVARDYQCRKSQVECCFSITKFDSVYRSYAEKSSIEKIDHWNKSHLKRSSSSGSVSSASKKSLSFSQTPLTNSQRQNRQQQPSVRDQARIRGIKAGAAISEKMFYSASPSTPESADRNNINDNEN
ncbi:hypothetical protein BCR33DRAFT_771019 [Rhizoclosmatium globosum]|uniref:Uncharacterized protein n=1 Tax=Rhizoclosmatium globosum TaxID=329046 RepID=A0A1Y2BH61_9FUNG|nr:hypothetical protein BCR33DRAFT_771019 [Rhizoclosmatium globosum]|eukprot:ORY34132.1 hypothetical protein BCR33DRAFT_771019 [Rhizoclosmatium globosum]